MRPNIIPLIDPPNVPEYFVNGLSRIEDLGPEMRFTFYRLKRPVYGWPGPIERISAVQLVMPLDAVRRAVMQSGEAMHDIEERARGGH